MFESQPKNYQTCHVKNLRTSLVPFSARGTFGPGTASPSSSPVAPLRPCPRCRLRSALAAWPMRRRRGSWKFCSCWVNDANWTNWWMKKAAEAMWKWRRLHSIRWDRNSGFQSQCWFFTWSCMIPWFVPLCCHATPMVYSCLFLPFENVSYVLISLGNTQNESEPKIENLGLGLKMDPVKLLHWPGGTLLHWAAANGHLAVLRFLRRCQVGRRDVAGSTALHDAAWGGHLKVAEAWANGGYGRWNSWKCWDGLVVRLYINIYNM